MTVIQNIKLGRHTYLFTFSIGFTVLCLFFITLFCVLGIWQIQRYHEKTYLLTHFQHQQIAQPLDFSSIVNKKTPSSFQSVFTEGLYVNELTMLVQNKPYKNQIGFEVITPLRIQGQKKLLLINRGWILQPKQGLPLINNVTGVQQVKGYIKLLNERQFILGENILNKLSKPLQMQKIDIDEIKQITGQDYFPFILRLNATNPHGFIRDWIIVSSPPERHLGYAIQWFVMAFVLLIAYLCFCAKRIQNEEASHAKHPT